MTDFMTVRLTDMGRENRVTNRKNETLEMASWRAAAGGGQAASGA